MSQWAAITVLGRDRPGIVAGITQVLFEHGCNLEDSSATRLRDSFAMILIALLPDPPQFASLDQALQRVADLLDVSVDLRDLGDEPPAPPPAGRPYRLMVYGADHPGIVYRVSDSLAQLEGNITDIRTQVAGTPQAPVYVMLLEMTLPPGTEERRLHAALDRLRRELAVDVSLHELDVETL